MMKWKARTETTNIGMLELDNLTFNDDYMELSIDICDMSDSLKSEVDKAIKIAKVKRTEEIEAFNKEHNTSRESTWSDKPVVIDFTYLLIVLESGKANNHTICIGFHDAENDIEQWDCDIKVDLSNYANDLKKAVIKALIDKFF